jgi:hypothetical protein
MQTTPCEKYGKAAVILTLETSNNMSDFSCLLACLEISLINPYYASPVVRACHFPLSKDTSAKYMCCTTYFFLARDY